VQEHAIVLVRRSQRCAKTGRPVGRIVGVQPSQSGQADEHKEELRPSPLIAEHVLVVAAMRAFRYGCPTIRSLPKEKIVSNGFTVWCTGLPSSGKSALADGLVAQLQSRGLMVELINSGRMRRTPLGASLGFSKDDRDTNVRRHALAAHLLARNGVIAVVSAVSPYRNTRTQIRAELGDFVEVYASTPAETCIERDTDGNWAKALDGQIRGFTGVDDPYEAPEAPEVEVDLSQVSAEAGVRRVLAVLERLGRIAPLQAASEDDQLLDPSL